MDNLFLRLIPVENLKNLTQIYKLCSHDCAIRH